MKTEDVIVGKIYHVKYNCPIHGLEEANVMVSGPAIHDSEGALFPVIETETGNSGFADAADFTDETPKLETSEPNTVS